LPENEKIKKESRLTKQMSRIKKPDGTEEKVEFMKRFIFYKNEYL
jgi:hypothetical protein